MSIWDTMAEDAMQSGYWKPEIGKINKIRIITDPIKGVTAFKTGDQRTQYKMMITTAENPKALNLWGVSAKGALQQIVAIVKSNALQSLVGAVLQVVVTGDGVNRSYTIIPVELPSPEKAAAIAAEFPREKLAKDFPKLFATIPMA